MKPLVKNYSSKRLGRRGFTLIELLVVLAIIAILAAVLLPALVKAKTSARTTECMSRMKQWGLGFYEYTMDNEDLIPREGYAGNGNVTRDNWVLVQHKNSQDVWYNALATYVGVPPASAYAPPAERLSFYQRASLFHCPAAPFPKATKTPTYQSPLFSISMNSQLIESPYVPTICFNRIKRTQETVLFLDNLLDGEERVDGAQFGYELGQPSSDATRFAGRRHGRSGNLVFADGHGQTMPGTKVVATEGPNKGGIIFPEKDVVWSVPEE